MLARRLRRRANIEPALAQSLVLAGSSDAPLGVLLKVRLNFIAIL